MKTNITINAIEKNIIVSKAFYNKASKYGTTEYNELRSAMIENPEYKIVFKTVEKKTYGGLTFKAMEAYIKTQKDSEKTLKEFAAVRVVAKAKGSEYPLTKKWFLNTFPAFKADDVSKSETETLMNVSEEDKNNSVKKAS